MANDTTTATASSSTTSTATSSTSTTTTTTTTSPGETSLYCEGALYNLTTQQTVLSFTNTNTSSYIAQIVMFLGNGTNDLDGTGGTFELTLQFGSQVNQPDPQYVTFSTATRASVFTEQFPLAIGQTVYAKIKSPNAADTSVWVQCCIFEVGVESIRDDLTTITSSLSDLSDDVGAMLAESRIVTNVYDNTGSGSGVAGSGAGVVPSSMGTGTGVYVSRC